jgi:carbamate kinase
VPEQTAVIAIGGNSLIKDADHQSARDQYLAAGQTCRHIADMMSDGWRVVITHGNGPQVGFALRRSELAAAELPEEPLDACGASTQGAIGYVLQQNLRNELRMRGVEADVVTLIRQAEVAIAAPALENPSQPSGGVMPSELASSAAARAGTSSRTLTAAGAGSCRRRGRCAWSSCHRSAA